MKKIISILLCLTMLLGMAAFVSAEETTYTKVTDTATIKEGGSYVMVVTYEGQAYAIGTTTTSDQIRALTPVTVTNNTISGDLPVWTVAANDAGISLFNGSKYLYWKEKAKIGLQNTAYTWNLSAQDNGSFHVVASGASDRILSYSYNNGTNPRVTAYQYPSNSYVFDIDFYKLNESGTTNPGEGEGGGDVVNPGEGTTPTTPLVADGTYVIYNAASGKAISAKAISTYYRVASSVTVSDGKAQNPSDDLLWTVKNNDDGTVTITTSTGAKLSIDASNKSLPLDAANDTWNVVASQTDGSYYLVNAGRDDMYVEYYAKYTEFTTFTYSSSYDSYYLVQFLPYEISETDTREPLPTTTEGIVDAIFGLTGSEKLADKYIYEGEIELTGVISKIDSAYNEEYNNISVYITVYGSNNTEHELLCYRLSKGTNTTDEQVKALMVGDTITVRGSEIKKFYDDYEYVSPTLVSVTVHDHDWSDATCTAPKTCTICSTTDGEALDHDCTSEITTPPTCTEPGVKTYTCTREGCNHSYTEPVDPAGHVDEDENYICDVEDCGATLCTEHSLKHVEATESTYTEQGHIEHYVCEKCDAYFSDAEGTTEILDKTSVLLPLKECNDYVRIPGNYVSAGTYVIWGLSNKAMPDGTDSCFMTTTGATSTRLMGADLTITNRVVTTTDANLIWNLIEADGGFYVQNAATGTYLYYDTESAGNKIYQTEDITKAGVWKVISSPNVEGGYTLQEVETGRMLSANLFGSEPNNYLGFAAYGSYEAQTSCNCALQFYQLATEAPEVPDTGDSFTSVVIAMMAISAIGAGILISKKKEF